MPRLPSLTAKDFVLYPWGRSLQFVSRTPPSSRCKSTNSLVTNALDHNERGRSHLERPSFQRFGAGTLQNTNGEVGFKSAPPTPAVAVVSRTAAHFAMLQRGNPLFAAAITRCREAPEIRSCMEGGE